MSDQGGSAGRRFCGGLGFDGDFGADFGGDAEAGGVGFDSLAGGGVHGASDGGG